MMHVTVMVDVVVLAPSGSHHQLLCFNPHFSFFVNRQHLSFCTQS